ncbi:putative glutathione S-transferase-like [Dorcoceras hygrometricum]|uniref:Putative glutathione S-transferase-like n=1 Tax=Dorcoceras hygrometricum TaxID=472368 RepID=A0A2Z7AVL6_9LAMI|nr:putative glutathione S-transferase-like [Dorcoceras hygrometricum]
MSSAVWRRNADVYKSSSEEKRPALRNQIWTNQLRREKQFEHKHHGDYIVQTDLLRPVHIRAEEQAEKGVRKKSEKEYKCRKAQRKQRVVLVASLHTQVTADVQAARVPRYTHPASWCAFVARSSRNLRAVGSGLYTRCKIKSSSGSFLCGRREDCLPACMKAFLSEGEEQVKAKEEVQELLKFLDNELNGKKFFGGERIGFVDIAGNVLAYWCVIIAELVGIELITDDKFPHLCTWMEVYLNSSFIKEHMPDREKLADSLRARFQKTG